MRADESNRWVRQLGLVSAIVVDILGYTGAGIGLGYLAWTRLAAPWWILLVTSSAGLTLGMYQLYRLSRREL